MSEQKVSKENHGTRLFAKDNLHLTRKVKELKYSDKRFDSNAAAIRHYVHLGISLERRTDTANTLDDKIIKASQKEVVTDSLLPLKTSIDSLITAIKKLDKNQNENFVEARKNSNIILKGIEQQNEILSNEILGMLKSILKIGKLTTESLRNIIVLRSILYVFLLAYKTGKINPKENLNWEKIITSAHQKAQELSMEEITLLQTDILEKEVIKAMSEELFIHIRNLNKTTTGI